MVPVTRPGTGTDKEGEKEVGEGGTNESRSVRPEGRRKHVWYWVTLRLRRYERHRRRSDGEELGKSVPNKGGV